MPKQMTLAERMAISYSHISDEYPEAFIKRLHRTQGSTRLLVRNPDQNGMPYGCHGMGLRMYATGMTFEQLLGRAKREGNGHEVKRLTYWNTYWNPTSPTYCG